MAKANLLKERQTLKLRQEIKENTVKQLVAPTFDRSAWQMGGKPPASAKPKPTIVSKVMFDKSLWKPPTPES